MNKSLLSKFQLTDRWFNHEGRALIYFSQKSLWVESLRGVAIILVVIGHIIGSSKTGGMKVDNDSVFRYLYFSLEYIRMPLFTVISGWVYANKPVTSGRYGLFILGKLRRLVLPMLVMSSILFICRAIIPGTSTRPALADLPLIYIFPYDLYWYLASLFLIFLVVVVLDRYLVLQSLGGWLAVLVSGFIVLTISNELLWPYPNFFSFKGAIYLFPFFLCGIGFYRFGESLFNEHLLKAIILICLAGIITQQLSWFGFFAMQKRQSALGVTVGLTAVYLLFHLRMKNNLLAWIGGYAYSIFLFHVFFTGGTRIVLLNMGIGNKWIILLIGLVISLGLPIILENLFKRTTITRFCFLGLSPEKRVDGLKEKALAQ